MGIIFEYIYDLIEVGIKYLSVFVNWYILQISAESFDAEHLLALQFEDSIEFYFQ